MGGPTGGGGAVLLLCAAVCQECSILLFQLQTAPVLANNSASGMGTYRLGNYRTISPSMLPPSPPPLVSLPPPPLLSQEFDQLRTQQSPSLDPGLVSAPSDSLSAAHAKARAAVDVLMLTDAPLLYPPGALAAAALRSGLRSANLSCQQFLKHIAAKGAAVTAAGGTAAAAVGNGVPGVSAADAEQHHQQLLGTLAAIDQLAAQQGPVTTGAVQTKAAEIDLRVRKWKKNLAAAAAGRSTVSTPAA